MVHLERIYQKYRDQANFLLVVISDAPHVVPGLEFMNGAYKKGVDHWRTQVARALAVKKMTVPTALDTEDFAVERALAGWPSRIVGINTSGSIAFDGGPGAHPPQLERWLSRLGNRAALPPTPKYWTVRHRLALQPAT